MASQITCVAPNGSSTAHDTTDVLSYSGTSQSIFAGNLQERYDYELVKKLAADVAGAAAPAGVVAPFVTVIDRYVPHQSLKRESRND